MVKKIRGRHGSRWVALQGLYAWSISGGTLQKIETDLSKGINWGTLEEQPTKIAYNQEYLHELIHEVGRCAPALDALLGPYLDRSFAELNPVEHTILRIAFYELQYHLEIPYKVIINEAILLAREFGAQDGHKFVNGVLDKAVRQLRVNEFAA